MSFTAFFPSHLLALIAKVNKSPADKFDPVAEPLKNARTFHWLVGPFEVDSRAYAKAHKYDLLDCKHVKEEADILGSRPPLCALKIHYLRGWENLPQDLLARLRYIAKQQN